MLLPDLTPWASEARGYVYDWTVLGNQLRLTTAMANVGAGRLELRGGATNASGTQDVYQRIYESNGSFTDVLAGTFIYHPEHGHIHFEDFAEYRLREVLPDGGVGNILASGEKVSFCLLDVDRYDTSGPASPYFLTCGQVQGISAGWSDVYDRGLPGQSIDITGVADGQYWLEVMVDPLNRIAESDETNNVVRIQINLQRPIGGGPIAPDAFEANDAFENASILAPPEDHTYANLSIHETGNDDYFRITASATGQLSFDLSFLNADGDIDLEIYDSARALVGRSESVSNGEHVSVNATAGNYFYVRAYGYNGAVNKNYSLIVDQADDHHVAALPTAGDDDIEGTNNADTIRLLAGDDRYHGFGGADVIFGDAGNDQLDGGVGADQMTGGTGDDTFIVDNTGDRVIELNNQGIDTVRSSVTHTLAINVENLELTGTANINGTGNWFNNDIMGNSGVNVLDGGYGTDTLSYAASAAAVNVKLLDGIANAVVSGGDAQGDVAKGFENVTGSAWADVLTGNSLANVLNGGLGADTLTGGGGNDVYLVNETGDQVIETLYGGTDKVKSSASYTLSANVENLDLIGTGDIDGIGNGLSNTIAGNASRNLLDGGIDVLSDRLTGGLGDDVYRIRDVRDILVELANQGTDTVLSSITYTLAANFENLELQGSSAINGNGNGASNVIVGNSGANILNGMGGRDFMTGGSGADRFAFTTSAFGSTNVDTIADFEVGIDKIGLSRAIFYGVGFTSALSADAFYVGAAAHDTTDRIIYDDTSGRLYFDSNGVATGGQVEFAVLDPGLTLQYTDFWII